ncbi:unnamed protein product [Lactuca virosa]|uniref:Uncharacterized protein n=1 Tax=Lactuca virosa TaxID=75947 RepID=A0AAU9NBI7_9ASTR|nr:unnamed protein product [Lactuca virosa]
MGDKHKPWPIGPVTISPLFDFLFISLGLSLLFDLLLVDPCDSICIGLLLLSSSIILHSLAHARLLSSDQVYESSNRSSRITESSDCC